MTSMRPSAVWTEVVGDVLVVTLDRQAEKNAVDGATAQLLYDAFVAFENNPAQLVAVLWGANGTFCAGADLKRLDNPLRDGGDLGPMGPTRLLLSKPVIAAVEGYAVAGGLELALWCDLRVVAENATFGVYCRRFGVPLIDGGTVRLSQVVGSGRALDAILTGRSIAAAEALSWGLANRVVPPGKTRVAAVALAQQIAAFPQVCARADRLSHYRALGQSTEAALRTEFLMSKNVLLADPQFQTTIAGKFKARL